MAYIWSDSSPFPFLSRDELTTVGRCYSGDTTSSGTPKSCCDLVSSWQQVSRGHRADAQKKSSVLTRVGASADDQGYRSSRDSDGCNTRRASGSTSTDTLTEVDDLSLSVCGAGGGGAVVNSEKEVLVIAKAVNIR